MSLSAGDKLGPYDILGLLGAGGMGKVYRARDTRLHRDVAIKVSSGRFSQRFEREARAIAQLNHPNICTLYDIGPDYLVMELVEGETLAKRLKTSPMPANEAVRIAQQIAEALDVAHDQDIVHRDLKPGNVMIRPDGLVKVLDFGLAKIGDTAGVAPVAANQDSPTLTMAETEAGVILGTAAYMAPEQAMGKPTDKRADVYAFGAVVYEMVTGQRLHRGVSTTEVLASVIKEEPPWDKVPVQFQRVLRSCLAKDPNQRLKHIGDAMRLAEDSAVISGPVSVAMMPAVARPGWLWPVVAVVLLAGAAASWWLYGRGTPKVEALRFQILEDGQFKLQNTNPSVSPDGKWVAFAAPGNDGVSRIWLRALDSLESRPIPGTETPNLFQSPPFWSFDSKTILFSNNTAPFAFGQLMRVDIGGGTPQAVCNIQSGVVGAAWNPEGVIVFADAVSAYLKRVAATGGEPMPVTTLRSGDRFHMFPQFLPDGRRFLYYRSSATYNQTEGIYVGSLDVPAAEQSKEPVLRTNRQAYYSPAGGGHLLFLRDRTLFAQPFDPGAGVLSGELAPVADGVSSFALAGVGNFTISNNGVLAYNAGPATVQQSILRDRASGKVLQSLGEQASDERPKFSADSKKVARMVTDAASGTTNIWVTDLASGNSAKITYGAGRNGDPVWSPDGQYIVFASNRSGITDLYLKKADGSGEERLILKTDREKRPTSWSRNGFLLFQSTQDATGADLWVLPHPESGNSQPVPYLQTKADELEGQFSPDGKWVAYASPESGQLDVYVRPFDPERLAESAREGRWLLSRGSGTQPVWTKDGSELLYISLGRLVAQEVDPAKPNEAKGAVVDIGEMTGNFAVSPDGSKLLMDELPAGDVPGRLVVVKNWHAVLQK
ncbi:MAG: protein kinase [Acidobacteriota bacterium]